MTNEEIAALPVGTIVKCSDKFGRKFVATKYGTAQGYGKNLWHSTYYKAPMDDFLVKISNPVVIGVL